MKEEITLKNLMESARKSLNYLVEGAIINFTEQVVGRMENTGTSRTALATKINSSPAYVTKFLRGGTNFTLESMVKVAEALDSDLKIDLVPKSNPQSWLIVIDDKFPVRNPVPQLWAQVKSNQALEARGNIKPLGLLSAPQYMTYDE